MLETIQEKVSVLFVYNREKRLTLPWRVRWQGRVYTLTKLGYHHKVRQGATLLHIFSGTYGSVAFRLSFDTDTLTWMLEEVSSE